MTKPDIEEPRNQGERLKIFTAQLLAEQEGRRLIWLRFVRPEESQALEQSAEELEKPNNDISDS